MIPSTEPQFESLPAPRVPIWGWRDVGLFFGLGLPAILIAQLLAALTARLLRLSPGGAIIIVSGQTVAYVFLFGLLAAILRMEYHAPFWRSLGWIEGRISAVGSILLGIFSAFGIAALGGLLHIPDVDSPMKKMLDSPHGAIVLACFGTLVAPVAEELAFRGFLQPLMVRSLGAFVGILLTALAFGMLHFAENAGAWPNVALISIAGFAFGVIRHVSRSTRASVLAHAAYNGTLFFALFAYGKNGKI